MLHGTGVRIAVQGELYDAGGRGMILCINWYGCALTMLADACRRVRYSRSLLTDCSSRYILGSCDALIHEATTPTPKELFARNILRQHEPTGKPCDGHTYVQSAHLWSLRRSIS